MSTFIVVRSRIAAFSAYAFSGGLFYAGVGLISVSGQLVTTMSQNAELLMSPGNNPPHVPRLATAFHSSGLFSQPPGARSILLSLSLSAHDDLFSVEDEAAPDPWVEIRTPVKTRSLSNLALFKPAPFSPPLSYPASSEATDSPFILNQPLAVEELPRSPALAAAGEAFNEPGPESALH